MKFVRHFKALCAAACLLVGLGAGAGLAVAQSAAGDQAGERGGRTYRSIIRFITDSDYPPFNYLDEDGALTGFNVDLARALCLELDISCDVQARAWKDLIPALKRGETDAVIASIAINPRTVQEVDFSDRYFFMAGRFASRKDAMQKADISPVGLEGKRVSVVKGTAHEAFLKAFFRDCIMQAFDTAEQAREAVMAGKADLVFDDGVSLAFWIAGTGSKACCELRGGPFQEPRYFGDGVGVAIRKGDQELKRLINIAIKRVRESGQYQEIARRYFPRFYAAELERP